MADCVEILDSIMGSNKTNGILKWMDNNPDEKFLYISPLLSEVDSNSRLQTDLKHISFEYPDVDIENGIESKSDDLLKKLRSNCNIGATHSLYLSMTEEHLREIESRNYHVVIDEELGVIDSFDHYSIDDLSYLLDKGDIEISTTDGMITWVGKDVGTKNKYKYFSTLCNSKSVYATKRNDTMMVTQLPIKLFTCAKRVIIMTYMFDGNILDCFLKLKGVKTKPFTEVETTKVSKAKLRELITLVPPTNEVSKVGMSSSKYSKGSKEDCLVVSNYIRNVCRQYDALSKDVMYTFPKALLDSNRKNGKKIRPKSFIEYKLPVLDDNGKVILDKNGKEKFDKFSCWLHASCRATNKYSFKWCLIHAYDRYPNAVVETYLQDYGVNPKRNVFATSEICQWVWRSRIRNSEPIVLAIANKRMFSLFSEWLEDE